MTQRDLARATGIPQPAIARIERGGVSPRLETLERLLAGTGTRLEASPTLGVGVDRTLIRESLLRTAEERVLSAGVAGRNLSEFLRAAGVERTAEFQPEAVIRLLGRHGVGYVVIGGLAAVTHGAPIVTQDVDVCYARDPANLERLAAALGEVHAYLRGADPGLPFRMDARTLAKGDAFTLTTDLGWIEIIATPSGTDGYEDLARTADAFQLFGHRVLIAAVDDLIRMKRAAGRPKDLLATEELGALRQELDRPR